MMKTFDLKTGGLESLVERSEENGLPNTSRYAWPTTESGRQSANGSYPSRASKNSYFARNSPHPNRVKHMKGLLDIPICTVTDRGESRSESRFSVNTPTATDRNGNNLAGIFRLPVNAQSFRLKEKAIPTLGMVPMMPHWREELRRLTEGVELPTQGQPLNHHQPPGSRMGTRHGSRQASRQGSRLGSRDAMRKMEDEFVRKSLSRNGQRLSGENTNGDAITGIKRPLSREKPKANNPVEITPVHEEFVFGLLTQILQTSSLPAIQNWLVNAPEREKQIVMDMIKAVSTSDEQVREGMQRLRNPALKMNDTACEEGAVDPQRPAYGDQLLQHESSVEHDEIEKYNKEWRNVEAEMRKEKPKSLLEKLNNRPDANSNSKSSYDEYEWSANASNNKPSTPFKIMEKEKPRPGTAEAEIEEIRSKLASRGSVKVFDHNKQNGRPSSKQDAKKKAPPSSNSDKGGVQTVAPFSKT
eukprot:gene16915-18621_t